MRRVLPFLVVPLLLLTACNDADDTTDEVEEVDEVDEVDEVEEVDETDEAADDYSVEDQPDAAASFVSPSDGDTVSGPVEVELAADGVELTEAGAPAAGEAHLHVMADIGCVDDGEIIPGPSDEHEEEGYFHLGDGSDARELDLGPGTYELCVQLGDGVHVAFGETETIEITVE
jgi:hypothetical protein